MNDAEALTQALARACHAALRTVPQRILKATPIVRYLRPAAGSRATKQDGVRRE